MSDANKPISDEEFMAIVRSEAAKFHRAPTPGKSNVFVNCIWMLALTGFGVVGAPFSGFVLMGTAVLGLGFWFNAWISPDGEANQQQWRSIVIGCLLGLIYPAVVGSFW